MNTSTASKHYTYSDYLQFSFDGMVELIKGKIFKMSPAPSSTHQAISIRLSTELFLFFQKHDCQVFTAPFDVVLPVDGKDFEDSDRVVQPDLCVICDKAKVKERGCFGAPDWIIEILSPHTAKKDLQDKYTLYEESGVQEYWVVDPVHHSVEVFSLQGSNYQRISTYVAEDQVSPVLFPELSIDLGKIFAQA